MPLDFLTRRIVLPARFCALLAVVTGFVCALAQAAEPAKSKIVVSDDGSHLVHLSWDTEGGAQSERNLLRAATDDTLLVEEETGGGLKPARGAKIAATAAGDGFELAMSPGPAAGQRPAALVVQFRFNVQMSAVSVLPGKIDEDGTFHFPAVVSAPGFGQMRVTCPDVPDATSRLTGSRQDHWVDWTIRLPRTAKTGDVRLRFEPVVLAAPAGVSDTARWQQARRAWFNMFQPAAEWGHGAHSAPSGMLANNVISDPVSCCLFIYADAALWTPQAAEGVSLMALVGRTLDWWLEARMLPSGEVPGYWRLTDFLDANPSLLIAAWDYFEATQDQAWLAQRIERLERAAEFLAGRDLDGDGLLEAVQSGNAGTLKDPMRSCSAYDAVNCGYKDAYSNELAYRGFCCLAELEGRLDCAEKQKRYGQLADKLKASFLKKLFNPETGLVGMWRSKDGVLHDYAAPWVNLLAIEYGLVDRAQGADILDRLQQRMQTAGFTRYDLGIPCTLLPVRREDYLLGNGIPGLAQQADGSDTFGQYLNGGVISGDNLRYLTALYMLDRRAQADAILDQILARVAKGDARDGGFPISIVDHYPEGGEFWTWDGHTCGYEGLLTHAWAFIDVVAMREPALRERLQRPMRRP